MKHGNIQNIILIAMVLVCIYLSSNVWLRLPDLFDSDNKEADKQEITSDIDVWNVVRPDRKSTRLNSSH